MRKIFALLTMIVILTVSAMATGIAENADWANGPQEEVYKKLMSNEWTASVAPMFCEEEIKPIVDPTTCSIYLLAKVKITFNKDGTLGGKFTYMPARYVKVINNNIRDIETNNIEGKEEITLKTIQYNNKDLKWTVSSNNRLIIMSDKEDGEGYDYLFTYALKSFGNRLYLANMNIDDRLVLTTSNNF